MNIFLAGLWLELIKLLANKNSNIKCDYNNNTHWIDFSKLGDWSVVPDDCDI